MGIGNFFKRVGTAIEKQAKKFEINFKRNEKIRTIKVKYLSKLSHRKLVQIYKTYFGE